MARFQKGDAKPPNSGRKPGQPNRKTALVRAAIAAADDAAIITKVIEGAKNAEPGMLALYFRYLRPTARPAETFPLPKIETAADLLAAMRGVLDRAAKGELSVDAGERVIMMLANMRATLETATLADEIETARAEIATLREAREGVEAWPQ